MPVSRVNSVEWVSKEPCFGDIVRVKVSFYYHYGIFVSESEVIQFGLPDNVTQRAEDVRVLATDVGTFLNGGDIEVGITKTRHSPQKTVELARSRIGEAGYDILHNNCEHFATECALGKSQSFLDAVRVSLRQKLGKND